MRVVCSFDGAVFSRSHASMGLVLKDLTNSVVEARGWWYNGLQNPLLVEAVALQDAIRWCQEKGLSIVQIEGDAKIVIDKVNAGAVCDAVGGSLLE
ncbi:unnamed protein product [Linum trigynum]|uniref:RNase H type-1 domain-containing protein n=1 Tax=Linum trigynum TaxID=586398 RepID=A0AAV2EED2_9ROSI